MLRATHYFLSVPKAGGSQIRYQLVYLSPGFTSDFLCMGPSLRWRKKGTYNLSDYSSPTHAQLPPSTPPLSGHVPQRAHTSAWSGSYFTAALALSEICPTARAFPTTRLNTTSTQFTPGCHLWDVPLCTAAATDSSHDRSDSSDHSPPCMRVPGGSLGVRRAHWQAPC